MLVGTRLFGGAWLATLSVPTCRTSVSACGASVSISGKLVRRGM